MEPQQTNEELLAQIKKLQDEVAHRTEQLIASTSSAYSFLDTLNMGFVLTDMKPEIVVANDSVRKIFTPPSQPDQPVPEFTLATLNSQLQPQLELNALIDDSLTNNKSIERDGVNYGQFVLRIYIAPLVNQVNADDKQQIGAVILIEDITEQKNLERSKDEFLSIASHELRTPLTAIRGNSALITKYYAADLTNKDLAEMVNDIHESSVRLIEIVNDFLDVSALEQGKMPMKPEPFELKEIITDVVRDLHELCQSKGIELIADPSIVTAPPVMADIQRIKQVIYNLVGNAVKFTEHGSITISTKADEGHVYVWVVDTGRGMSLENQKLLFRKFQQANSNLLTRDTTKGTGLGLYISKLIVELSGGKITLLKSEEGVGSTFGFSLPRADQQPQP